MAKNYESERLNALLAKPERVVEADETQSVKSGLVVRHGKREGAKLERELAAQTLAGLLSQARVDSGLSVRKVAEKMGKHPSRVGAIEKGNPDLTFRAFVEYAYSLGYTVEVKLVPSDQERPILAASLPGSTEI